MKRIVILLTCWLPLLTFAADTPLHKQLSRCSHIADNAARLSCFDSLVAGTNTATAHEFGRHYLRSKNAEHKQPQAMNVLLIKTRKNNAGRLLFYFENGQIWKQLDGRYLPVPKQLPAPATISITALGSHSLRFGEKSRMIKIKRVR